MEFTLLQRVKFVSHRLSFFAAEMVWDSILLRSLSKGSGSMQWHALFQTTWSTTRGGRMQEMKALRAPLC